MMRSLLVNRFPILLIDESQDTDKELIEALFYVQAILEEPLCPWRRRRHNAADLHGRQTGSWQ